jgi:hypothetical protein
MFPLRAGFLRLWFMQFMFRFVTSHRKNKFLLDLIPINRCLASFCWTNNENVRHRPFPTPATRDFTDALERCAITITSAYAYLRLRWWNTSLSSAKIVQIQEMSCNRNPLNEEDVNAEFYTTSQSFTLTTSGQSRFLRLLSMCPSLLSVCCFLAKICRYKYICLLTSEHAFKPGITILV